MANFVLDLSPSESDGLRSVDKLWAMSLPPSRNFSAQSLQNSLGTGLELSWYQPWNRLGTDLEAAWNHPGACPDPIWDRPRTAPFSPELTRNGPGTDPELTRNRPGTDPFRPEPTYFGYRFCSV